MTEKKAKLIIHLLEGKNIHFEQGLSADEVLQIEAKFGITFPPDLKLFLQTALPASNSFVHWRRGLHSHAEADKINTQLNWPLEGMLFDIRLNNFWIDTWGNRPDSNEERMSIARQHFQTYPKLLPIYSHRYIASQPCESGNPVFSVYQMDIIYYGFDLATYLANEFHFSLPPEFKIPERPKRKIEFWSDWVD